MKSPGGWVVPSLLRNRVTRSRRRWQRQLQEHGSQCLTLGVQPQRPAGATAERMIDHEIESVQVWDRIPLHAADAQRRKSRRQPARSDGCRASRTLVCRWPPRRYSNDHPCRRFACGPDLPGEYTLSVPALRCPGVVAHSANCSQNGANGQLPRPFRRCAHVDSSARFGQAARHQGRPVSERRPW